VRFIILGRKKLNFFSLSKKQQIIIDILGIAFFIFTILASQIICLLSRLPGKFGNPCDFAESYATHLIINDGLYRVFIMLVSIFFGAIFINSFYRNEKIIAHGLRYYFFYRMAISLLSGVIFGYIACELNTLFAWQSYSFECLGLGA
jgi:hypothetical protein